MFCIIEAVTRKMANHVPIQPVAMASRSISSQKVVQRSRWFAIFLIVSSQMQNIRRKVRGTTGDTRPTGGYR